MAVVRSSLYTPRLRLVIDDLATDVPVVRFNSSFELNAIPRASVSLPVGWEFLGGAPSPIHALAEALGAGRHRARVLLTMRPPGIGGAGAGPTELGIPTGEFTVFDGFTDFVSSASATASLGYTIQLVHWLDDLNFSSVFSKTSHPANPADYTFGALSSGAGICLAEGLAGGGPGAPTGGDWTGLTHALAYFDVANVQTDFWLKALRPWLTCLCQQDSFWIEELELMGSGGNDQALAALARMGGGGGYAPLGLDLAVDLDLAIAIAMAATNMTQNPGEHAQITIWDSLIARFAAEFLFAVVPLVDRALVVPYIAGYRRPYLTIPAYQGTQVEWTSLVHRALRGMAVTTTMEMATGAGLGPDPGAAELGPGGFWSPDPEAPGQIMVRGGPDWLTRFSASRTVDASTGGHGGAISDGMVPDVTAATGGDDTARLITMKTFLTRYAQTLYAQEMARGRQAVAAGPVRFDVAPGSSVLVYPVSPSGIAGDQLQAPFHATVVRASTYIDAESTQAGTGFHLAHCRNERENESDRFSIAKHPLYNATFAGCGLLG